MSSAPAEMSVPNLLDLPIPDLANAVPTLASFLAIDQDTYEHQNSGTRTTRHALGTSAHTEPNIRDSALSSQAATELTSFASEFRGLTSLSDVPDFPTSVSCTNPETAAESALSVPSVSALVSGRPTEPSLLDPAVLSGLSVRHLIPAAAVTSNLQNENPAWVTFT